MILNNINSTLNVLDYFRENKKTVLINFTTDKVYKNDDKKNIRFKENDKLGGLDPYSFSKSAVDLMTTMWKSTYFNKKNIFKYCNLRSGNIIIGADPAVGSIGFLIVLSIAFIWGMGFAGYSVAAGVKSGSSQGAQAATFLFFPAIFLAPTFVPREALKGWLETAAAYNPTTYVIEAMRAVMVDGWELDVLFRGYLSAGLFAALTLTLAVISARKATEKA